MPINCKQYERWCIAIYHKSNRKTIIANTINIKKIERKKHQLYLFVTLNKKYIYQYDTKVSLLKALLFFSSLKFLKRVLQFDEM